ncbi:MAG: serpin family protein [Planctomycetota bacterium]|nr:MAG: serpin family protein [Planctomycetota bacterium]
MRALKCVLVLFVIVLTASDDWAGNDPNVSRQTDKQMIVEGNNRFALDLYEKLQKQEGNLFFSPFSISTALAMTYAGARGETEKQMSKLLHFSLSGEKVHSTFGALLKDLNARGEKGGYELTVANALWGQRGYGFLKEFLGLVKTEYGSSLNEVDFAGATEAARQTINDWVKKETRDKIKELIGPGVLDSLTRLVLTNAIYFKGNWAKQFKEEDTQDAPFTLLSGTKVNVPMMNRTGDFNYMETEEFQGLELPYVDNELSMIILLPKEIDGLGGLEKTLTTEKLSRLSQREVIVSVPKFRMTSKFGLADVLKSMGMKDAFVLSAADFSGMDGTKELFISAVIHKAYVDVNEEGTEAAAATGVKMRLTAVGPREKTVFRADHPFLFLIRDNHSGSILFLGRLMNPKG